MSLTFFTEPFYSLADFDRLFDEAFANRAGNGAVNNANANNQLQASNASSVPKLLRPRCVPSLSCVPSNLCTDATRVGWTSTRTPRRAA